METKNILLILAVLLIVLGGIIAINYSSKGIIIGGDKDKYGCLIGAGYSYDEKVGACTRSWELNEDQKKAAKIAVAYLSFPVTIVEASKQECEGCYNIRLQRNDNQERIEINLKNWSTINNAEDKEKNYCTAKQKSGDVCTEEYAPVCGWSNQDIKCIKYPCAQTFSNKCFACHDDNIAYWTIGECPK
jgi:hypothetical protein